jgi:hypothetical protein
VLTAITIGDRRDDELPFDPGTAFRTAHDLVDVDVAELLQRFYGEGDLTDDEIQVVEAEAVRWEADSYRATAAFLPTIVGWLSEPDDDLAAYAAALLPWLPPNPAAVSALIDVPTHQVQARASANLALAHLPHVDPRIDQRIDQRIEQHLQRLLQPPGTPVAVTAAVALAYRNDTASPEHVLSILIDAATQDLPTGVTGWDRALRGFVRLALQRLGLS